jgi:hypothetical protein
MRCALSRSATRLGSAAVGPLEVGLELGLVDGAPDPVSVAVADEVGDPLRLGRGVGSFVPELSSLQAAIAATRTNEVAPTWNRRANLLDTASSRAVSYPTSTSDQLASRPTLRW